MARAAALLAAAAALAGCTLTEVITPEGRDLLVVESVLRTDQNRQRVLLHRSLIGNTVRGEAGARVVVRTEGGRAITFVQQDAATVCRHPEDEPDAFAVDATCYLSEAGQGRWVVPGGTYRLEIETARGERLHSRTVVPGAFAFDLPRAARRSSGALFCELPPAQTFRLSWSRSEGTWSYLARLNIRDIRNAVGGTIANVPDRIELTGLSISERDTGITVPTNFGVFERFEFENELLQLLQRGFPLGVDVGIVLIAADRNYVNGVRGGRFNPSGNVRTSSIVGDGVGVFGSVVPLTLSIVVRQGPLEHPCSAG